MLIDKNNNIHMIRGDAENLFIQITDKATKEQILLSPDTEAFLTMRERFGQKKMVLSLKGDISEDGDLSFGFNMEATNNLDCQEHSYDIRLKFPNGDPKTIIPKDPTRTALFTLYPENTRFD